MPHANAPLTERGRLRLARCVVDDGWPLRRTAERFQVSVPTAQRWARRYRERDQSRPAIEAMQDRSSRPKRSPRHTRSALVQAGATLAAFAARSWSPRSPASSLGSSGPR